LSETNKEITSRKKPFHKKDENEKEKTKSMPSS
jgi:hypothetical protein